MVKPFLTFEEDTDGDGIPDEDDLDDDNDGIPDTIECPNTTEIIDLGVDGTFEQLANVASNDAFNSNVTGGGWVNGVGSADTWVSPMPTTGTGVWGGLADGTPPSPDGGVFATARAAPESFYTDVDNLVVGATYELFFYHANTGIEGSTILGSDARWKIDFGAEVQYSTPLPYLGEGNQIWYAQTLIFTATATTQRLEFTGDIALDGGDGLTDNPGIDGIQLTFTGTLNCLDTDEDGVPDSRDLDSDNDGISDLLESGSDRALLDPDGNGVIDGLQFVDLDGDGLADALEALYGEDLGKTPRDSFTSGTPDYLNLDTDGDGIPDTVEARPTAGYLPNDGDVRDNDLDGDGILDIFDFNDLTIGTFGGNFSDPQDTDDAFPNADGVPDYLDTDSDGDGTDDRTEGGNLVIDIFYTDPDGSLIDPSADLPNEIGDSAEVAYREYCIPPVIDMPQDLTVCDSYTLPELAHGAYFGSPNGVGPLFPGHLVETSQVIYVYSELDNFPDCSSEHSFTLAINTFTAQAVFGPGQSYCNVATPEPLRARSESVATGSLSYQWQISRDSINYNNITEPAALEPEYTPESVEGDTWYRRVDTSILNGLECPVIGDAVKVTILPAIMLPEPEVTLIRCDAPDNPDTHRIALNEQEIIGGTGTYPQIVFMDDRGTPGDTSDDIVLQSGPSMEYFESSLEPKSIAILVIDDFGCEGRARASIEGRTPLNASLEIKEELCTGDNNASIQVDIDGGVPPYNINLDDGVPVSNTSSRVMYEDLSGDTEHWINIEDSNGCTLRLNAILAPSVDLSATLGVDYFCATGSPSLMNRVTVEMDPTLITDVIFRLDNDPTTDQLEPDFQNLTPGDHILSLTYRNGCVQEKEFSIKETRDLDLTLDTPGINTITAQASGGEGPYEYSFDNGTFGNVTAFTIWRTGTYTVSVRDSNGCEVKREVFLEFFPIQIPNFFTPDADGTNDGWTPTNLYQFPNARTRIFDRYGRQIYVLSNKDKWDGTYESQEVPSGDYWYILTLNSTLDGREFIGHFTLYR
ncbi:MAG: T9SS type B sorting domain-containing protein [Bacteroidota bacterium]